IQFCQWRRRLLAGKSRALGRECPLPLEFGLGGHIRNLIDAGSLDKGSVCDGNCGKLIIATVRSIAMIFLHHFQHGRFKANGFNLPEICAILCHGNQTGIACSNVLDMRGRGLVKYSGRFVEAHSAHATELQKEGYVVALERCVDCFTGSFPAEAARTTAQKQRQNNENRRQSFHVLSSRPMTSTINALAKERRTFISCAAKSQDRPAQPLVSPIHLRQHFLYSAASRSNCTLHFFQTRLAFTVAASTAAAPFSGA